MSYKLVIKGQSENAEFPAVDSAEFPRMTLYDGTYIPLVEDDGSDGTTLKVRIDDKVYRLESGCKFTDWEFIFMCTSRFAINQDFEVFYNENKSTGGFYTITRQSGVEVYPLEALQAYTRDAASDPSYCRWMDYAKNSRIAGATIFGGHRITLARLKNKKMNFTEAVLIRYDSDSSYVKYFISQNGDIDNASGDYISVSFASGVNISIPPFAGKVKIVKDNSLIMTAMCDYGFTYNSSDVGLYGIFLQAYEEIALPEFEFIWQYEYSGEKGMLCGNPKAGIEYAKLPYDEFKGQLLKQLCPTTYRAPFSVIGTQDGNQYHIYRENVTVTNGEGLRVCYGYQLSVDGKGVGTTGLLFDGDVRTLITVTYQSIRDYSPFTSVATLMYDSTNNITYCDVGNVVGPIVQNPPFVKVWEGTANIWSYALPAARTYFDSKPYHLPVLRCDTSRTGTGDPTDWAKNQAWTILQNNPTDDVVIVVETDPFYAPIRGASYITVTVCISGNKPTGLTLKNFNGDTSTPSLSYYPTYNVTVLQGTLWANTTTPTLDDFIQSGKVLKDIGGDINSSTIMASNFFNGMSNYAVRTEQDEDVRFGSVTTLPSYSATAKNTVVTQAFPASQGVYNRLILAKKGVKYTGCEMAFIWYGSGASSESCIIKQNNDIKPHSAGSRAGDFITIDNANTVTVAAFTGVIKYKLNGNPMITMDASNGLSLTMSTDLYGVSAIFCYPNIPYDYVLYRGIAGGAETDMRATFKCTRDRHVTCAYKVGDYWNLGICYESKLALDATVTLEHRGVNDVWIVDRQDVSTGYVVDSAYGIAVRVDPFSSTDRGDAELYADSFNELVVIAKAYFDSH